MCGVDRCIPGSWAADSILLLLFNAKPLCEPTCSFYGPSLSTASFVWSLKGPSWHRTGPRRPLFHLSSRVSLLAPMARPEASVGLERGVFDVESISVDWTVRFASFIASVGSLSFTSSAP